jgi:Fur family ferric uptake transcriptional regulator
MAMVRKTRQRDAIRKVLEDAGRPLGAQEVLDAAEAEAPGLGIATVYRALKGLLEEGWLASVEIPGEAPRYEPAGKAHHDHFQCRKCERVYEVDDCPVRFPRLPKGFLLDGHEVVLTGVCADCSKRLRI